MVSEEIKNDIECGGWEEMMLIVDLWTKFHKGQQKTELGSSSERKSVLHNLIADQEVTSSNI